MNASNEIVVFQNGKEALQYLKQSNKNVDLILLDINMPIMNGWQFLDHYENLKKERHTTISVILLTSSANRDDKQKAEAFESVKKFINKPLTPQSTEEIMGLFE